MIASGVALFGVFVIWSLSIARYGGPDEPAHVLRAAAVASGELLGEPSAGLPPGYRSQSVPAPLVTGDPSCFRHDDDTAATCAAPDREAAGTARAASSAGTYPPLYYALVGIPVRLLSDGSDVEWYRIVAAFWCAATLALAIGRSARLGPAVVLLVVSPAAWFLFGVVNPNSLEIALVALAWVGVERLRSSTATPIRADAAWVAVPLAAAIVIRPVASLAGLAMAGVLVISMAQRPEHHRIARTQRFLLFGLPLASMVAGVGWNLWADVDVSDARTATSVPIGEAAWRAVDESTETWREAVGSLGWLEFSAPWFAHVASWSIVGVAAWVALSGGRALRRCWLWILAVFLAGPVLFEVVFAGRIGFIWQGRYSIPTGIGLLIVGMGSWRARLAPRLVSILVAVAASAQFITLWVVLQRYSVGIRGSLWFRGALWHPLVPPFVLLAGNGLLMVALVWLTHRCSTAGFGDLATNDVECGSGPEPFDLLGTERMHADEVDR